MFDGMDYFLTAAEIAIAFVAVSMILIVLRQVIGQPLSNYQLFIVRSIMEISLAALQAALLPSVLRLFSLPPEVVWRAASALLGIFLGAYYVTYWFRRRRTDPDIGWLNFGALFNVGGSYVVALVQLYNAIWAGSAAVYATGVGWMLLLLSIGLIYMAPVFLRASPRS
jgi:hypothetical protein